MGRYRLNVETSARDPLNLRQELENFLPDFVDADDLDEAERAVEVLVQEYIDSLLSLYAGPRGTEPTGLSGLCVGVTPVK
jgi:hypothetical protein